MSLYTSRESEQLANTTDALSSTNLAWLAPDTGAAETVADTNIYNGTTYYDFDASGNLIATTYPQPNGATNYIIDSATFDANFNPLTETESTINPDDGSTTGTFTDTFTYTNEGLPQTYTNLAGKVWSATYSGVNLLTTQDPVQATQGIQEVYSYDDASQPNLPTSYTDADAGTWNFAYNSFGQILTLTPPNPQNAATMTYNGAGYPATATDGNGNLVTFDSYDALGDLLSVSTYPITGNTSVHNTTTFAYDARQRPTTVTNPDGTTSQNVYVGDHLDHTLDEASTQYNFFWCPVCGALTGITGPLNWGLHWHYDGDHQLSTFTDANQHVTTYTYGLAEELDNIAYPDGSGFSYSYNNRGQVYQVTNGRGDAVQYTYDNLERLTEIDFPTSGQASIVYTYNDDDTVHTVTDGIGVTTFTYTPAGRVHSVVYNYSASGLTQQQELDYVYNLDGSRQSLTWQTGLGQNYVWNYGYDGGGRLVSVTDPFQQTTVYAYDGEDKITSQTNANTTSVSYTYNQARGWPTGIQYSTNTTPFATYNLTYDNAATPANDTVGNLTGVTEIDGSTETYGYDALYRLTGEARADSNNNALYGATYTYDLAGNSTQINVSTQIEGLSSFTYNAANTITSLTDNAGTNDQFTLGVTSDGDGNMTGLNGMPALFTWDDRNKLIATQSADGGTLQYGYDAFGHRVVSLLDSSTLTFYIFDGDLLLGELQVPNQQMSSLPGQPNRKSASAAKKPQVASSAAKTRLASSHGPGSVKSAVSTTPPVMMPAAAPSSQTPAAAAAGSCPPSNPMPPAPAPTTAAGGCPPNTPTPAAPTMSSPAAHTTPTTSATTVSSPPSAPMATSAAPTATTAQPAVVATAALASLPAGGQTNPRIPPYFLKNPPGPGATPDTKQLKKKRKPKQPPSGAHPDDETTGGSSQPTVTAVYTWGASGLVSEWTSSLNNSLWYAFGPQGETRELTDSTGAVADTYVYSAYGTPVQQTGSDVNPFQYGGQVGYYSDANNPYALMLCGYRWYFYGLQRWLSRDPAGYAGGENFYRYCLDNPLRFIDPNGLDAPVWLSLGAYFAGLAAGGALAGPPGAKIGGPVGTAIAEGLWAHFHDGADLQHSLDAALEAGLKAWLGDRILGGILDGIANSAFVRDAIESLGCEAKAFFSKLVAIIKRQKCFVAETLVQVVSSEPSASVTSEKNSLDSTTKQKPNQPTLITKPINQIHQDDLVACWNEQTRQTEYKRVLNTVVLTATELVTVSFTNAQTGQIVESVTSTPEHPFYVEGKGFVPAGQLAIGNAIVTRAGPALVVTKIETKDYPQGVPVYNIEVEGAHNFFVGKQGLLVHNGGDCLPDLAKLEPHELNALMGSEQRNLLKKFMGQGLNGARARATNFQIPEGLSRDTLKIYKEIAQKAINKGGDRTGVQAERLKLCERGLKLLK